MSERREAKDLTPRAIVEELDRYIVGQRDAKRAVSIALRNRWRRQQVEQPVAAERIDPRGAFVTGSHLDSVPDGGPFDGPLGIVSAFTAIDLLRCDGVTPRVPVGIVAFSDEEGARFGVACVGSQLSTGALHPERALNLRDGDGTTLADALRKAGRRPEHLGADPELAERVGVYVELHVEQGRALDLVDRPVAVASAIWPHGRWRFTFCGAANHAGTTRLTDRRDPMRLFADRPYLDEAIDKLFGA